MKPVSIRFKCFGPYMTEQYIDFALLEKNGLFLICGETGSGKTTILDAMCYALYGKSSGGLRGNLADMRCKLAGKSDETLVEFVFDISGQRYKFIRTLKYSRINLNDEHKCFILKEGQFVPLLENQKATFVNKKAEELIGLTYEQFRQVIILPQGKFEDFLVSNSAEKEKMLVSLFRADRWQRIADEISRCIDERDEALKQEHKGILDKLKNYSCETIDMLEAQTELQGHTAAQLEEEQSQAVKILDKNKAAYESALLVNRDFEELQRRQDRLKELSDKTRKYDEEEALLKNADSADKIKPQFEAYSAAKAALDKAAENKDSTAKSLVDALSIEETAKEKRARHEAERSKNDELLKKITLLENARPLYLSLEEKQVEAEKLSIELKAAEKERTKAETLFKETDQNWLNSMEQQKASIEDYQSAQSAYIAGIGGILAKKLVDGRPCPVCGSTEHPMPARSAGEHVTEAELEAKNIDMQKASDAVSQAQQKRSDAENTKNQTQKKYAELQSFEAAARAEYENALSHKIIGIETSEQLENTITGIHESLSAYELSEQKTMSEVSEAQGNRKAAAALAEQAESAYSAASKDYEKMKSEWHSAMTASGFESTAAFETAYMEGEQKQLRREELIRFRSDLSRAQKEFEEQSKFLAGRIQPNMDELKKLRDQSEIEKDKLTQEAGKAKDRLETMLKDVAELISRKKKHDEARALVDADLVFAKRLQGRTGVSLQRYVLGVMLTSVTIAANRMLKNVHGGRYQLFRTNEIAGSAQKGGLELEVYDSRNNERRSVTTLSGGEKFLVALSLAIGLSTVVQAQGGGIRMEAIFIDEGFGSLDRSSINDALEILQGIQRSSGIVGTISHVEQLAETIPTKIQIIKDENGSRCVVSC